jgi:ABC-2 type transport system ATP-binding protein
LQQIGLADRAGDLVSRLSGGMRRRVNIAAALMHDPSLLILDEPTVGLDFEAQSEVMRLLRALAGSGMAMILVTHDFDEAQALAQRLAVLVGGRIRGLGSPGTLVMNAFGNVVELVLVPSQEFFVAGLTVDLLIELGFRSDARGRTWSIRIRREDPHLGELLQAVASGELPVDQLTIRNVSLESLIEKFASEPAVPLPAREVH